MDHLAIIRSHFPNSLFTAHDLKALGISRHYLETLLKSGEIQKTHRGIYFLTGTDLSEEAQFRSAIKRISGPSAVCLLSALSFYHLVTEIPRQTWLLVPEAKHTAHKDIRLLRSRNPQWKIGIAQEGGYRITTIERSIVDALVFKKLVGLNVGLQAMKTAIKEKKTTLDKILRTANALRVDHRIINYIEALA